jgi:16S rRNA C967 or C1407 C5-methylase (RsmB/RsmF family)
MGSNPSNLLLKLSRKLFSQEGERSAFVDALTYPQGFSPAILWTKPRPEDVPFEVLPPLPWQPDSVDRLQVGERAGQHPLHDQGDYYCLDFSSVFEASVLQAIPQPVEVVLDLCAAPGGKSLLGRAILNPDHLLSNEVIRKRVKILISNLKRCGAAEVLVFNLDSQIFAEELSQSASAVIVDAPCTGQSLLAKGDKALGCFHPVNINKSASRQKRIIANAAQTVAAGGYLAYMTCTFSAEENEQIGAWLMNKFPQFEPVEVPFLNAYASSLADYPCYRLWPQSGIGAGGFTALFLNTADGSNSLNQEFLATKGMKIYLPGADAPLKDPAPS